MTLKDDYQCVMIGDVWHLVQEQSNPPTFQKGSDAGCYTMCCKWAQFNRGYDKKRPTCVECLEACVIDEKTHGPLREAKKREQAQQKGKKRYG